ncbi:MAG TPA: hypothetical protein DGN59_16025, partial [Candidatus Latescibacteria bacterium]|nr:hypothetical protein [Candidatus Latescibacterota bacterium]
LGDYCLELHANGDKDARIRRNIEQQLSDAIDARSDPKNREWQDLTTRMDADERSLDHYRDAIHEPGSTEISLWTAREDLLTIGDGDTIDVPRAFLDDYSRNWPMFQETLFELVDRVEAAVSLIDNPWRLVDGVANSLDKPALSSTVDLLASILDEYTALTGPWRGLHDVTTIAGLDAAVLAARLAGDGTLPSVASLALVGGPTWNRLADEIIEQAESISGKLETARQVLRPSTLGRPDLAELAGLSATAATAGLFSRGKHRKAFAAALGDDAISTDVEALTAAVQTVHAQAANANALTNRLTSELNLTTPDGWNLMSDEASATLGGLITGTRTLATHCKSPGVSDFIAGLATEPNPDRLAGVVIEQVIDAWRGFGQLVEVTDSSLERWRGDRTLLEAWNADQPRWTSDRGEGGRFLELDRWMAILNEVDRFTDCGLPALRDPILAGTLLLNGLEVRVRRGVLQATFTERLEAGDVDNFDGLRHDQRIRRLERLLTEARSLLIDRIPGLVSERKKQPRVKLKKPVGEAQDLLRGLKPQRGMKVPIRTLVQKFGGALSDVMPCFLMSPDSVATLVPVGSIAFDVVIFDEASQVRTSHAIGALGRGSANIVVGDSKQMPPTGFFSSNRGRLVEDDPDDADIDYTELDDEDVEGDASFLPVPVAAADVESILGEFEESGIPHLQLTVHYRSRDESLIAFSNSHIYEKPMLTFPSATVGERALQFRRIDGQYTRPTTDPNRLDTHHKAAYQKAYEALGGPKKAVLGTNPDEAIAMATKIMGRLRDPERQRRRREGAGDGAESMIAVTLNVPQKKLVEALLKEADSNGESVIEAALVDTKDEETGVVTAEPQLKIRNLEAVQGDEADTVLLSIAFTKRGPGEKGAGTNKVPMNFGPVTKPGGHRRLNVAVTRARAETIVFCSFDPSDMNVKSTSSEEAQLLQHFLRIAHDGTERHGDIGIGVGRSHHINDIAAAIIEMGYRVDTQLGLSELRVDIAVGRSDEIDWRVAVLIDGPDWAERGSATQREVLPKTVLLTRGWQRVLRVWLPSWRDERDAVLARIRDAMDGTDEELPADPSENAEAGQVVTDEPQSGRLGSNVGSWRRNESLSTGSDTPDDDHTEFKPFVPQIMYEREHLDHLASPGRWDPNYLNEVGEHLVSTIDLVLEAEAPVESNRLARLVANCWGLQRVMQNRVDLILNFIPTDHLTRTPFGDYVWSTPSQAQSWTEYRPSGPTAERQPHEIAPKEFTNALVDLVEHYRSVSKEDGTRSLASIFGFDRLTKKVRGHIEAIIDYAIQTGVLSIDE